MLLLEAGASMRVTWRHDVILIWHLVKTNVWIAFAVLMNLMGSTSLGCWRCTLSKDMTTSYLRLRTRWLSTAWSSTDSIRIVLVAVLTDIQHSFGLLIDKVSTMLRVVLIISLNVNILIVVDWRNIAGRSLWTNSQTMVCVILIIMQFWFILVSNHLLLELVLVVLLHLVAFGGIDTKLLHSWGTSTCWSSNWVTLIVTRSLAVISFFFNDEVILSALHSFLMNFHI